MCEAVAILTSRCRRAALAAGLCKRQGNLAREPLIAPIKTHLTSELASNYFFHDARTEPAVRGPLDGRPA